MTRRSLLCKLILALWLVVGAQKAQAQSAYLGIESSGNLVDGPGRAFLLVTDSSAEQPLLGTVFFYQAAPLKQVVFFNNRPRLGLLAEQMPAAAFYQQVVIGQNLSLFLMKLKLSADQVLSLQRRAHAEATDADFAQKNFFGPLSSNSIVNVLRLLNEVLEPERRLKFDERAEFLDPNPIRFFLNYTSVEKYGSDLVLRFPVSAAKALEKSNLVDGKVQWLPKLSVQQAQNFTRFTVPALEDIETCYRFHDSTKEMIGILTALFVRKSEKETLTPVVNLLRRSPGCSENRQVNMKYIDSLAQLISPSDTSARSQLMNLKTIFAKLGSP